MNTALAARKHAPDAFALARHVIEHHSKSFSLAARLLPSGVREDAVVLYAYCRRVDDAIDRVSGAEQRTALDALQRELDGVYSGRLPLDPLLGAFARVVRARGIPRAYPEELLLGMRMDAEGTRYRTLPDLLRYCHCVAGTVGLMMCHVMGVRRPGALVHAAHLGIAMQLTNIARDIHEDWRRGRLYVPDELLGERDAAALHRELGGGLPAWAVPTLATATRALLGTADAYYRSGDAGLLDLSPRCAFAVRAARLVYARIGAVVRAQGCDPLAGRAVVRRPDKAWLVARAALAPLSAFPRALFLSRPAAPLRELPWREAIGLPGGVR
jgi:15-cis-phytoene synthase